MKVKLSELKDVTKKALLKSGYNEDESNALLEVLMYAQTRGNNQGVVKLIGKGIPKSPVAKEIEVEKETSVSALINAHQTHAMITVNRGVEMAMDKAKEHGMAMVGINGIDTSSGALGFYVRKIARENLVGIIMASSPETVAAAGSYEPIFGTNPFAIGVPGQDGPLVLDMATAAMAYFGVIEANTAGRPLPEGIAYDKAGNLTTNAAEALDGALRTFDKGYKGSHLSMMVQILAGPMIGAAFMSVGDANNWGGHFIIVLDPELFSGLDHLRSSVAQIIKKVKATKKLPGVEEILIPSERGNRVAQAAEQSGEIEIEDNLYKALLKVSEEGPGV